MSLPRGSSTVWKGTILAGVSRVNSNGSLRCVRSRVAALTGDRVWTLANGENVERVLRYPDGHERRIRYPGDIRIEAAEMPLLDSADLDSADSTDSSREDRWGIECYYYGQSSDEEEEDFDIASASQNLLEERQKELPSRLAPKDFPNSPAELLKFINSKEFKSAAEEQARLVRQSYQVLEHSPWLQTKAVYVLATSQRHSEEYLTYTLKTRVGRPQQEDEFTKILGRRRPDGSSLIRVEEIRDGVVTFEDENDAHRYAALLEADGTQAVVAECDSHTLFRETSDTKAVVVFVQQCQGLQCHLPLPEELRASLKGTRSLEDDAL